jgi:hypothetical protein
LACFFSLFYRHKSGVGIASIDFFEASIFAGKTGERPAFFFRAKVSPELHSTSKGFPDDLILLNQSVMRPADDRRVRFDGQFEGIQHCQLDVELFTGVGFNPIRSIRGHYANNSAIQYHFAK